MTRPSLVGVARPQRQDPRPGARATPRRMRRLLAALPLLFTFPAVPADAQELKTLGLEDYPRWSRVTNVALAPDGRWLTYAYAPNEGDATFHVRELDGSVVHTAVNGASAAFSEDGRWVAFLTSPPESEQQRLRRERRPVPRAVELIDLRSGARSREADAQSFRFSADARFLLVEKARPDATARHQGRDLIVIELASGSKRNIGNFASFSFNDAGTLLAYTVDAANRAGNGLYLLDPATGYVRGLDTDTLRYDRLTWNDAGTAVAVLRGETPARLEQRANTLIAFSPLPTARTSLSGSTRITRVGYDPAADAGFPAGMVLSELGGVTWSRDGTRIFVGVKEQQTALRPAADEERTNVEIWHWADERVQSQQRVQSAADARATYAGVVDLQARRFVQLADADMRSAQPTRDGRWAIGLRDKPYRMLFDEPGSLRDIVRIDTRTGERETLVERVRFVMGTSPDSRWHLWFSDGRLLAQELATQRTVELSAHADASFVNEQADRPGERGSYGIAGWTRDGRGVIANARRDLWLLPLSGGTTRAVDLTRGIGEREQIRFRVVTLDEDTSDEGIDTTRPIILSAFGERDKKSGYWILEPGREPRPLIWEDRQIGALRKAKHADRVIYTRQSFEEFPDWWTATARFAGPRRVTDANPQQTEYRWGRNILVDFTDRRGNELQATVTLPAGYVEGRRYPTLIYFYERQSQNHHSYSMPVYDDRPHFSAYASDGYLVVRPDIVYDDGRPGTSALDDVTSAARRVIELGLADPDRIGLQGHSWGGYQSSFIVTQTDMFAAVVTGAPLTNLESMHNILYRQTGNPNAALIQWGQGRMGTVPWLDPEGYARESPVRHVRNISTPFLIMHGTADGAVDWNQGLEFYIAARREGKHVILLSYADEPHHLAQKPNQLDFQRRMKEYFDHYLKDVPAPRWITDGVPFRDRAREVQERAVTAARSAGGRQ